MIPGVWALVVGRRVGSFFGVMEDRCIGVNKLRGGDREKGGCAGMDGSLFTVV